MIDEEILYVLSPGGDIYNDGVYASVSVDGTREVIIFTNNDDAIRYQLQLEAIDVPMDVVEVETSELTTYCELNGFAYVIVEEGELVFPRIETLSLLTDEDDDNF
jgi:hypothetical protein